MARPRWHNGPMTLHITGDADAAAVLSDEPFATGTLRRLTILPR
jgi:hypothetical protein